MCWIFNNQLTKHITDKIGDYLFMNMMANTKMTNGPRVLAGVDEIRKQLGKDELIKRINAMDDDELQIIADNIPIELCFNRIQKELERCQQLEKSIKDLTATLR